MEKKSETWSGLLFIPWSIQKDLWYQSIYHGYWATFYNLHLEYLSLLESFFLHLKLHTSLRSSNSFKYPVQCVQSILCTIHRLNAIYFMNHFYEWRFKFTTKRFEWRGYKNSKNGKISNSLWATLVILHPIKHLSIHILNQLI